MCENSFWVENLTAEKKPFAPDTSQSPFVKRCCEGIYRAFLENSKGCPCEINDICIYFKDL
jgi:hypothetical protein